MDTSDALRLVTTFGPYIIIAVVWFGKNVILRALVEPMLNALDKAKEELSEKIDDNNKAFVEHTIEDKRLFDAQNRKLARIEREIKKKHEVGA